MTYDDYYYYSENINTQMEQSLLQPVVFLAP